MGHTVVRISMLWEAQQHHKIREDSRKVKNSREDLSVPRQNTSASPPSRWMTQGFKWALGRQGKGQGWCLCALENCFICSSLKRGLQPSGTHAAQACLLALMISDTTLNQQLNQVCCAPLFCCWLPPPLQFNLPRHPPPTKPTGGGARTWLVFHYSSHSSSSRSCPNKCKRDLQLNVHQQSLFSNSSTPAKDLTPAGKLAKNRCTLQKLRGGNCTWFLHLNVTVLPWKNSFQ